MTKRGDDRKLMNLLARNGYTVVRAASGHWKIFDGDRLVSSTGGTPSDHRSRKNFIKDLRRKSCSD